MSCDIQELRRLSNVRSQLDGQKKTVSECMCESEIVFVCYF